MSTYHDALVQDRIAELRREAEEQRLVRQLRRARRADAARRAEETPRRAARTSDSGTRRRVLRWGTGA